MHRLNAQHWEEFTVIRVSIGLWKTAGKLWPIKFEFSVRDDFCLLLENSKKFLHQPSIPIIHYISSWIPVAPRSPKSEFDEIITTGIMLRFVTAFINFVCIVTFAIVCYFAVFHCFKELDLRKLINPPLVLKVYPGQIMPYFSYRKGVNYIISLKCIVKLWFCKTHIHIHGEEFRLEFMLIFPEVKFNKKFSNTQHLHLICRM